MSRDENDGFFLYFGFGSNLLSERIRLRNPSAVFVDIAELKGYRLCFGLERGGLSTRWHGCIASIEPSPLDSVWGVCWRLKSEDLPHLDEQEDEGDIYRRITVNVRTPQGESLPCWSYNLISFTEGIPSPQYISVIQKGALQNNLPEKYRQWLDAIPDNGYRGDCIVMDKINTRLDENEDNSFLYFAYGSNLLKARVQLNNPTAEYVGLAKLEGYRLCFKSISPDWQPRKSYWRGAPATIDESADCHVWGVIWRIALADRPNLDMQEGCYDAIEVTASSPEGTQHVCRTYQLSTDLDEDLPSPHYMKVIVEGAIRAGIPAHYLDFLKAIPHNGDTNPPAVMNKLF